MVAVLFFTFLLLFVWWNETELTWDIGQYWTYCTSPWMMIMMIDEHGAVSGMRIGRGNQSI
jgi:hypothetical protein